jgi:hypothetical protein
MRLDDIDVQGAWRQVIDVRALKATTSAIRRCWALSWRLLGGDGAVMPAEGFQRVLGKSGL